MGILWQVLHLHRSEWWCSWEPQSSLEKNTTDFIQRGHQTHLNMNSPGSVWNYRMHIIFMIYFCQLDCGAPFAKLICECYFGCQILMFVICTPSGCIWRVGSVNFMGAYVAWLQTRRLVKFPSQSNKIRSQRFLCFFLSPSSPKRLKHMPFLTNINTSNHKLFLFSTLSLSFHAHAHLPSLFSESFWFRTLLFHWLNRAINSFQIQLPVWRGAVEHEQQHLKRFSANTLFPQVTKAPCYYFQLFAFSRLSLFWGERALSPHERKATKTPCKVKGEMFPW